MMTKMRHRIAAITLALMMTAAPVGGSAFAATEFTEDQPDKPVAESYEDNDKIEEYNKKVDEYNKSAQEYNESVDKEYEAAVEETNAKNAEIEQHNEAEVERVKTAEENNAKAEAAAAEENAKIDEENAAEEESVNKHNESEDAKVEESKKAKKEAEEANEEIKAHNDSVTKYEEDKVKYDEDYAQYQTDLIMEQKILALGYSSVEQYNDLINKHYNEPAKKSVERNANANIVSVQDTYKVTEAEEKAGASVSVRIEHIFEGTDVSYSEDFEIDRNDILNLKSIAALGNSTEPGYASLYYTTDDAHSMGYWVPYVEFGYNAKYVVSTWDCGTAYEVSYKDGKNHANDKEEIVATYYYTWIPLKTYKTYNTPSAPTELTNPGERKELVEVPEEYTPEYRQFVKKEHVTAELEEIAEANILEKLEAPIKKAYVGLLSYMDLFDEPEEEIIPAATVAENSDPAAPAAPEAQAVIVKNDEAAPAAEKAEAPAAVRTSRNTTSAAATAQEAATEIVTEQEVPMTDIAEAAPAVSIEDNATPLAVGSAWALLNLIMTIVTGIISAVLLAGYFGRKDEEEDEEDEADTKRKGFVRAASLIPAIGSLIIFILTEDMSNPMILTDRWTILMAVILLIQAATAIIARKSKEDESGDEMTEAMDA